MRKRQVVFSEEFSLKSYSIDTHSEDDAKDIVRRGFEHLELTGHIKLDFGKNLTDAINKSKFSGN